jgi:uncharacterized protein YneF (UPF0154 family)
VLFLVWGALLGLAIISPGLINSLFFLAQWIASWIMVIVVAIVGALLLGMFISHRLITHGGFTPFEEEMMRMRKEVQQQLAHTEKMREEVSLLRVDVARLKRSAPGAPEALREPQESAAGPRRTSQAALAVAPLSALDEGP